MKRIDENRLLPGDILLTTTSSPISKSVRLRTRSPISHAMLCVAHSSVIDSTMEGVQARNVQRLVYADRSELIVLRPRKALDATERRAINDFMRMAIGTRYSIREAFQAPRGAGDARGRGQFCSRLVAQAYAAAGIRLVPDPAWCTPEDLRTSDLLEGRGAPVVSVSFAEARAIRRGDTTEPSRKAHNAILQGGRMLDPTIETLQDLMQHVVDHPEHDGDVARLLEAGEYLTLWRTEYAKYPWRFDLAAMTVVAAKPGARESLRTYCERVVSDPALGGGDHAASLSAYRDAYEQLPLRTLAIQVALYERLVAMGDVRRQVAAAWLAEAPRD